MKRKRDAEHSEEIRKEAVDNQEPAQDVLSTFLLLENAILESRKNYNNIPVLLDHARVQSVSDGRDTAAAVVLYRVICKLMALGNLTKIARASKEENTIVQWLRERRKEYEEILLGHLQSEDPTKQIAAVGLLMRLIKEKSRYPITGEGSGWDDGLLQELVHGLIASKNGATAIDEFVDKYVSKHADIRYHAFISIP